MDHPLFEIVRTTTGAVSIRNKAVNEIMHNPVGPWIEANSLYVDQSELKLKLSLKLRSPIEEEFVLYDVGLGAAANALAAVACAASIESEAHGRLRPLRIVSFERDLELLKFALQNSIQFAHFQGQEAMLKQILANGHWSNGKISWELRQGEFLDKIETEIYQPHLIYFDPYSPSVNKEMWTTACFEKIHLKSRSASDGGTSLYTYSQATRIRAALMRAGFYVGYGLATGFKKHTTVASTVLSHLKAPLGFDWYETWQRSDVRYPFDCKLEDQEKFDQFMKQVSFAPL